MRKMATVVDRTTTGTPPVGSGTVRVLLSVHTPDYPVANWIHNPDLSALAAVAQVYWKVVGDLVQEMIPAEKDAVDLALLPLIKWQRCRGIDARTDELLAVGVEYPAASGNFYAVTSKAMGEFRLLMEAAVYPFDWDSNDNSAQITVSNATQAQALLTAAANACRSIVLSGTAIKQTVRACTTAACVAAVVDPR